jgi:ketosteroid isomerase-like protein
MIWTALLPLLAAAPAAPQPTLKEIEELEVAFNGAYERNELDAYFSYFADDVTMYFETGRVTLTDYKKDWYGLIKAGGGVEDFDLSDMRVQFSGEGDVAIATYRIDVLTRQADGSKVKEQAWETDVWFKRGGQWKLAHAHYNSKVVP